MSFRPGRVRGGEWIMGAASLALLICLFALPWYGFTSVYSPTAATLGVRTSYDGWQSLEWIRLLVVLVCFGGMLALWWQATRPAPALPVCATVVTTVLGVVLGLALIYRVLISLPENSSFIEAKSGAYAGLILALAVVIGGYLSLREDGIAREDAPREIETLRLTPRRAAPAAT